MANERCGYLFNISLCMSWSLFLCCKVKSTCICAMNCLFFFFFFVFACWFVQPLAVCLP